MAKHYHSLVFLFLFFTATYAQTTAIPDANFEQALIDLGIDTDNTINQSVATADISGVTYLDVNSKNISDLTGIEDFISLTSLFCNNNQLTSLDVSQNTALTSLVLDHNLLTNLDVSQNTALDAFDCAYNELTTLDVSKNVALTFLSCDYNQLTSLDVSQNTALNIFSCSNNKITQLEISQNTALIYLSCYYNQLISLDLSKNIGLTGLWCYNNQLTSLDLSQNTAIITLDCKTNQLTSLDVSNNTVLEYLFCDTNQLTGLDVSNNTALITLNSRFNPLLTSLNVKNGNNASLTSFDARNNPSLTCIQVDNETAANAAEAPYTTWLKDASCIYSEDCAALSLDDDFLSQVVNVYPNPVSNTLNIDTNLTINNIVIYNDLGQFVKETKLRTIDTSSLSSGLYFVKVKTEEGTSYRTVKIIKE